MASDALVDQGSDLRARSTFDGAVIAAPTVASGKEIARSGKSFVRLKVDAQGRCFVEKTLVVQDRFWANKLRYEYRMLGILAARPRGFRTPAPLWITRHPMSLAMTLAAGTPLAPSKFATVDDRCADRWLNAAARVRAADIRGRVRRFRPVRWLSRNSAVPPSEARSICESLESWSPVFSLCHGDLQAQHVFQDEDQVTIIDWEHAAVYPDGFDYGLIFVHAMDMPSLRNAILDEFRPKPERYRISFAFAVWAHCIRERGVFTQRTDRQVGWLLRLRGASADALANRDLERLVL